MKTNFSLFQISENKIKICNLPKFKMAIQDSEPKKKLLKIDRFITNLILGNF